MTIKGKPKWKFSAKVLLQLAASEPIFMSISFFAPTNEMSQWNNFLWARLGSHFFQCETANLAVQNNSQLPLKHNFQSSGVFSWSGLLLNCAICLLYLPGTRSSYIFYQIFTMLFRQFWHTNDQYMNYPSTNCHMQLCKMDEWWLIMPFRWIIHSLLQVNKFRKCVMNGDISNRPLRGCNQATASSETWPLISLCPSVAIPSLRSKNGWFNSKTVPWLPPELGNGGEHCKSQIWLFRHLRPNWKSFWITTNVLQNRFHLVSCLTMRVNSSSLSIALCCDKVETPTSPLEKHPFLEHSIAVLWKLQPKTLNNNSGAPVLFHVFESYPCLAARSRFVISSRAFCCVSTMAFPSLLGKSLPAKVPMVCLIAAKKTTQHLSQDTPNIFQRYHHTISTKRFVDLFQDHFSWKFDQIVELSS